MSLAETGFKGYTASYKDMRARSFALLLALTTALQSPGLMGWRALADEVNVVDDQHNLTTVQMAQPASQAAVAQIEQAVTDGRISRGDADHAEEMIARYAGTAPQITKALQQLGTNLNNPNKDPHLALNDLFDQMAEPARQVDADSTFVTVLDQSKQSQSVAVGSLRTGQTLFYQTSVDMGDLKTKRTISRPAPDGSNQRVVEAIIIVEQKGSAQIQRVLYNRQVHELLGNLKKLYYDQCQLVREINNGANPPVFKSEACKNPDGSYQLGVYNKDLTPQAIAKVKQLYAQNQADFDGPNQSFCMVGPVLGQYQECQGGHMLTLRQYLDEVDKREAAGSLDQLDWRDLQSVQRIAMRFYGEKQLETMQKYVILELSSYFSQVTNSQPKQKNDGTEALDAASQDLGGLQQALTDIENGNLDGYGVLMTKVFKVTKLNPEDAKYITPELMQAAGEAMAYTAYAVKAKQRAFDASLSGEEHDAAIAESSQWLKLANLELQDFQVNSLAIQMERLRDGQLQGHMGLDKSDAAGQAEATKLAELARDQYLPRLEQQTVDAKSLMLKQCVSDFYMTIQNATVAYLFADTLRERLRTLAAKIFEMKGMYLASEFERVKNDPQYKGRTALDNLTADGKSAFQAFLSNLPADVAAMAKRLQDYGQSLLDLANGNTHPDDEIRGDLVGKQAEFVSIAQQLDCSRPQPGKARQFVACSQTMGDFKGIKDAVSNSAIKQAQFASSLQDLTSKMRLFDMVNELDIYLANSASPKMPNSQSATWWDKVSSFKWMQGGIDWLSGGFAGHSLRQGAIDEGMEHMPWTQEAFQKLGGDNAQVRKQIMALMDAGNFDAAIAKLNGLDPEAAKQALAEFNSDQLAKDPYANDDFDQFMSKAPENKAMTQAQGVMGDLFKQLKTYIYGYMAVSAAYDFVFTTVATAGLGQIFKAFSTAGEATEAVVDAARAGEAADEMEQLSGLARMWDAMKGIGSGIMDYGGRWVTATKNNFMSVAGAKATGFAENAKQFLMVALPKAAIKNAQSMAMMTMASSGMSYASYLFAGGNSQYHSAGEALTAGALGGAQFGAEGGMLMMASPIPKTALGNSAAGRFLTSVAESNGPVSATVNFLVRNAPGLEDSAVAKSGIMGWGGQAAEQLALKSPTAAFAARTLVWGAGMVDGGAKYFLAAEVPRGIAEAGHFAAENLVNQLTGGGQVKDGATPYVAALANAQRFGQSVAQVSWLMIPMEAMQDPADIREQKEQAYGLRQIIAAGRGDEIESGINGVTEISYDRSFAHQVAGLEFMDMMRGEGKTGTLTVNEGVKQTAMEMMGRDRPLSELAALGTLSAESQAGKQRVGDLMKAMGETAPEPEKNAKPEPPPAAGGETGTGAGAPAELPRSARLFEPAVERAMAKAKEGGSNKLYAYFSEGGALQRVSASPNGKNGIAITLEVGPDGQVRLERTAKGNMTRANSVALERFKDGVDGLKRVEGVLDQVNSSLGARRVLAAAGPAPPAAGGTAPAASAQEPAVASERSSAAGPGAGAQAVKLQPGEVFVTKEAVTAWKDLLGKKLAESPSIRRQLIEAKDAKSLQLRDPKTGQLFTVAGEPLRKLREAAEWEQLNGRATGFFGVTGAILKGLFQDPRVTLRNLGADLTGRPPETAAQAITRDLRSAIQSDLRRQSGASPDRLLSHLVDQIASLTEAGGAPSDMAALGKLSELAKAPGSPAERVARVDAELRRMAGGVDPAAVIRLRRQLMSEGDLAEVVPKAREIAKSLGDGPTADAIRARLAEGDLKAAKEQANGELDKLMAHADGGPMGTLASLSRSLRGQVTADDLSLSAHKRMDARIAGTKDPLTRTALTDLRNTLESDAYVQLANERTMQAIVDYRRSGRTEADKDKLRDAADLLVDTWERGVFGQRFSRRVEKDGELIWPAKPEIRPENQFTDANGNVIPGFRPGQFNAIRDDIVTIAEGRQQIYDLLQTSGGKTLLGFTLIGLLEAAARANGKDGALYVTANADLVQQANDVYNAFFKGRKPSFEIIDYSELMVRQAQAQRTGSLGPFDTNEVFMDEFDQVGMGTPLSLGKFNGKMSFARYQITEKAYRENTPEAWDKLYQLYKTGQWDALFKRYADKTGEGKLLTQDLSRSDFETLMKADRKFADAYRHAFSVPVDPVMEAMREGVYEVWYDLYPKYGQGRQSISREEFAEMLKNNEAFRKDFLDASARMAKAVRETRERIDPMLSFTPSARAARRAFIDSIPDEYAQARKMSKSQIYVEMLREQRKSLGGVLAPGVMTAKWGGSDGFMRKVLEGAFEAASEGSKLQTAYMKDPQRDGIIQFHNDVPLDSLDTFYRTALELHEGVSVTNDFENVAVTDFAGIIRAARKANAITIAASGTLPDNMRPYLQNAGTKVLGKGTDPNKAASLPHEIVLENSEAVQRFGAAFDGAKGPVDVWLGKGGEVLGAGAKPEGAEHGVEVERGADGRLTLSRSGANEKAVASLKSADKLESLGLMLDQVNAARDPGPEGTPYELAVAREGIIRLIQDGRFEGKKNIAYIWVESLGKMEALLKDLDAHGITMQKTSILTSPVSNFFLQERYMFSIRSEKNVEGLHSGDVEVVVLAGQGGLRGLEAPLGAYHGGEIKMFVTDSHTLADVSLLQLLGRIDRGRVPEDSKTTFVLLDDANGVMDERDYKLAMPQKIIEAAQGGGDAATLAQVEKLLGGKIDPASERKLFTDKSLAKARDLYVQYLGPEAGKLRQSEVLYQDFLARQTKQPYQAPAAGGLSQAQVKDIFEKAGLIDAKSAYRDYLALHALSQAIGPEKLAELMKLPEGPVRSEAAYELARDPRVMKILIVEMRRLAEYKSLQSSGILAEPRPSRWKLFWQNLQRVKTGAPTPVPAGTTPPAPPAPGAVPVPPSGAAAPGASPRADAGDDSGKGQSSVLDARWACGLA